MTRINIKKILISVLTVVFLLIVVMHVWIRLKDNFPNSFPLNDPEAEYKVTKSCPGGQGWIEQEKALGYAYCIEYHGNNVLMGKEHGNTKFFSITVGKSKINLEDYVGKNVKNIKGKFVSSSQQCIKEKCVGIGGPFVVLDIDKLE